ncbi:FKBP-type peptidyl-prolyl cis-trans isomerase [Candidatus Woesearchaeota archaeon]|nr:FKBP-type peptidyl-prolyl cis-trans isomerase [Candidatus Woesearchaeota archaeon]
MTLFKPIAGSEVASKELVVTRRGNNMVVKNHDFVEIEYTGKVTENGMVFDTTDKAVAEKAGIFSQKMEYGTIIVCVGEKHVLPGLDNDINGKSLSKEYTVKFGPELGFGKKDTKMFQLIATNKFHKEGIKPMPGLQINVDGKVAVVKSVTGGRTLVDFNHPLAGKELSYTYKLLRVVTDVAEKTKALVHMQLGHNVTSEFADNMLTLTSKVDFPVELQNMIKEQIMKLIPELKEIVFKKA